MNRFFYDATVNVLSFTMLGLILERAAATCFARVYEQTNSSCLAQTIVVFQWVCGIFAAISFLLVDQFEKDYWNSTTVLVTCSFVYTRPEVVLTLFSSSVILFCAFTAFSIFLYFFNRKKFQRSTNKKLTMRYQYKENVTTLTFLVPMFTVFGISNIISTALIVYMFVHITQQGVSDALVDNLWKIEKAYNATVSVYTIFFVFICSKLHHPLWASVMKDFKKVCRSDDKNFTQEKPSSLRLAGKNSRLVEGTTEGDVYFKTLRETWS